MKLSRRGLLAGVLGLPFVAALGKGPDLSGLADDSVTQYVGRIDTSNGVLCNFGADYSDTFSAAWSTLDTSLTYAREDVYEAWNIYDHDKALDHRHG